MKRSIDLRKMFSPLALLLFFSLLFTGCGGGGTPPVQSYFNYRKISIAGSSITHGDISDTTNKGAGYLGEKSYVGEVERYLREEVADTIGPNELLKADDTIDEPMSYQGKIKVYNEGTVIHATLAASDEIAIAFAGSDTPVDISLEVDGKVYDYTVPAGDYLPVKKTFDDSGENFYYAFRETNPQAVKIWKLDSDKVHTFDLVVKRGSLHLNFITNHMYYMQNAGVGGFEAKDFLSTDRTHSTVNDIIAFAPDVFIFESGTNDAKTWAKEILLKTNPGADAPSTNRWIIEEPVACSIDGKRVTVAQAVNVAKGDIVIIGDYQGDIQNMVVGVVGSNSNGNSISLSKIVSYSERVAHEVSSVPAGIARQCRIKSIKVWEDRVKEVVRRVKAGVGRSLIVGIGTSGVPNYYDPDPAKGNPYTNAPYTPRRLLGYREKGKMMAEENGWLFVDFFQHTLTVEPGVDYNHKWSYGDNTHPNDPGRVYFGQAVIDSIKPYLGK
jgi:lysophospholipase L1-like esterase